MEKMRMEIVDIIKKISTKLRPYSKTVLRRHWIIVRFIDIVSIR